MKLNSKAYNGHENKVNFVNFNPIASNIMVSGTSYGDIHIWESEEFKTYMQFRLPYNPSTILWSPNGDLIGITTKNKFLTIYDPRNRNAVFQDQITQNSLITKFAWLDNNYVATVGINSDNKKVLSILDIRKSNENQYDNFFLSSIEINQYTSVTVPYVNQELKLIYCVGKEESSIKIFDYCTGSLQKNNEFKAAEQNNFSVLLNRQYLNKSKMEVDRFARYTKNRKIFYVSFNLLPGQKFDGILYPSEELTKPQMNSNDWINGKKLEIIHTKLYQRKIHSNNNNRLIEQNNKTEKKNNSARKFFDKIVNIEKNAKNDDNKLSNSTPKNKDFEKGNKYLISKIIDLQNLLKFMESEKEDLSERMKSIKEKNQKYKSKINEYERIIQDLKNDYKQKEECSSKTIAILKSQIKENISLLKSKDDEIMKKDNIIKENQIKIKSLEEEKQNKLNINNIEEIKLEYENKLLLLKEELKKKYEDEMKKKIEMINNQYKENMTIELNNVRKNLIKTVGNNLKSLKDKYNNMFSSKEELNKMCNEIIKLNLNIKENEIYNDQIKKENFNVKKEISRFPFTLSENEYIILLIIMTKDEKIIYPLMCKNTDKINKIKGIFFKENPEYSENNGKFYCHNNILKDNESLEECKINTNNIIIFDYE